MDEQFKLEVVYANWREQRIKDYDEFAELIQRARKSIANGNIPELAGLIERLETVRCRMANWDTKRFIGNGFSEELGHGCKDAGGEHAGDSAGWPDATENKTNSASGCDEIEA